MHTPRPIAAVLCGPGRVLSAGIAILAAVFSVLAEGFVGVAVFAIVSLALLVAELWRDSSSLTQEIENTSQQLTTARAAEHAALNKVNVTNEHLEGMAVTGREAKGLRERASWLEEQLRAQHSELVPFLDILGNQGARLELVRRHRALTGGDRTGRWPVVSVSSEGTPSVTIVAFAASDCEYVDQQPVMLVATSSNTSLSTGRATLQGRQIIMDVTLDELPEDLCIGLERHGRLQPEGYAVELAGLAVDAYDGVGDDELEEIEKAMLTVMRGVSSALNQTSSEEEEATP